MCLKNVSPGREARPKGHTITTHTEDKANAVNGNNTA